jgi:16S rRNA (guanine527-N7)-methyltransferase
MNLTRIVDPVEVAALHVVDSLMARAAVDSAPLGVMCDIGAGAGYPGIPLGIVNKRCTVLLESTKKKAAFLTEMVSGLGLGMAVAPVRVEEYAATGEPGCAVAVARAVSALPSLVELAAPLLAGGGLLVAMKGSVSEEELSRGRLAAVICGLKEDGITRYSLPGRDERRALVVYRKVGAPTTQLPRRSGMAQHQPLA